MATRTAQYSLSQKPQPCPKTDELGLFPDDTPLQQPGGSCLKYLPRHQRYAQQGFGNSATSYNYEQPSQYTPSTHSPHPANPAMGYQDQQSNRDIPTDMHQYSPGLVMSYNGQPFEFTAPDISSNPVQPSTSNAEQRFQYAPPECPQYSQGPVMSFNDQQTQYAAPDSLLYNDQQFYHTPRDVSMDTAEHMMDTNDQPTQQGSLFASQWTQQLTTDLAACEKSPQALFNAGQGIHSALIGMGCGISASQGEEQIQGFNASFNTQADPESFNSGSFRHDPAWANLNNVSIMPSDSTTMEREAFACNMAPASSNVASSVQSEPAILDREAARQFNGEIQCNTDGNVNYNPIAGGQAHNEYILPIREYPDNSLCPKYGADASLAHQP